MRPLSRYFLMLFLVAAPGAQAEGIEDGWAGFSSACSVEMQFPLEQLGKSGLKWSHDSQENLRELKHMTEVSCPAYLHRRNDPVALSAFQQEKARLSRSELSIKVERPENTG